MFFLAAPLTVFSFWALAGIFTRSDAVRCVVALAWFALALSMGLYDDADVTMLTVMVFLPAAFASRSVRSACIGRRIWSIPTRRSRRRRLRRCVSFRSSPRSRSCCCR